MQNSSIPLNITNLKQLISKNFFLVILISIPSAIVADYFRIPLAWMIGPMIAISIAALSPSTEFEYPVVIVLKELYPTTVL